jgi:hypothetical protein
MGIAHLVPQGDRLTIQYDDVGCRERAAHLGQLAAGLGWVDNICRAPKPVRKWTRRSILWPVIKISIRPSG